MRRLIAYIITALSMLLAIGVAANPVITTLNAGREFTSGRDYREIVFNIEEDLGKKNNENRAEIVAEEMQKRLENYNVEDYSVKIQGEDKVAVSLAMNSYEFNYAAKYLAFSGGNFALVDSVNGNVKSGNKLFNPSDIRVEYKGDASVPTIIIPVTKKGKKDIEDLQKELGIEEQKEDEDNEDKLIKRDGESSSESDKKLIYLWANYNEERGENLEALDKDPVSRDKVIMGFDASSIWYTESKEKHSEIVFMCATADKENENQLDISHLKDDNARANYLVNMLKASKYDFEISCPTVNISEESKTIDYYENARILTASGEPLLTVGNNINVKLDSKTFIATAIAIVIVSLLLIVYYRLASLAMIATTLGTLFLTLASFVSMHVVFNIPTIVGFIILTAGVLFGEIVYVNRFKEEVYKGRSLKKANQEASKKSNLLTIDASIVLAFSGLMMYAIGGIGGSALKSLGVVLFFGAVISLLMNMLVFKLLMYLVTNSTNLQQKYNVFNIEGDKVPNIMANEEKPTYESPYENVNFTKRKSIFGIIFGALFAGSLACIIAFGVMKGSPLNVEKAISDTTVVYTSIKIDSETSQVTDSSSYVQYVLKGTDFEKTSEENVTYKEVSQYIFESDSEQKTQKYYYFTLVIDEKLDSKKLGNLEDQINDNLNDLVSEGVISGGELTNAEVRNSKELVFTPNQGWVALATGISIIGVSLYAAFRFRPSRGVALLITTTGATSIAYGAIVAMRFIGTTAITSVAMPLVAVTMMLASLFYFSTEKAMLKEIHEELTPEIRKETMIKALGKSAGPLFVFMLVSIYIVINFFGFGVENTVILFASALIGEVVAIAVLLVILGPLATFIDKGFSKIHLPKFKFLQKEKPAKQTTKRNSSEPEETIFIGIND